jgi:hypothetical protein
LAYPNEKLCIAVGDSGLVVRSTDKGETWEVYRTDTNESNSNINMYDENIGAIISYNMKDYSSFFLSTTNGGKTWEKIPYPTWPTTGIIFGASRLHYLNENVSVGFTTYKFDDTTYGRYLIYIYNNWESWDTVRAPLYSTYLTFGDENNVWTAGNYDELDSAGWSRYRQYIYHSSDGGHSWQTQWNTIYEGGTLKDIEFYDDEFGVASGEFSLVLFTDDGGRTWEKNLIEDTPPDGTSKKVQFIQIPDRNTVYAVYKSRYIYKLTLNTTSAAEQSQSPELRITPNPATDYIDVMLSEAKEPVLSVKVYDVLGVCVGTHPPAPSREGESVRIDVSGLAAGVYFVRVGGRMYKFVKM